MGMAASQVRLLALTDRLHDVELKAQQILAQKLALGTQKDALYNTYCDKLEATNYMVAFRDDTNYGAKRYVDANYENLCSYIPDRMRQYALTDTRTGNILVSQDEKDVYEEYKNDKYAFALAMMGLEDGFGSKDTMGSGSGMSVGLNEGNISIADGEPTYLDGIDPNTTGLLTDFELELLEGYATSKAPNLQSELNAYSAEEDETKKEELAKNIRTTWANQVNSQLPQNLKGDGNDVLMTEAELRAFMQADETTRGELQGYIDQIYDPDCKDQQAAFNNFRDALYDKLGKNIFTKMEYIQNGDSHNSLETDYDKQEFDFYVNKWEVINQAGGCEVVDPRYETGDEGREWLENMVKAGLVVIQECGTDGKWQDTSIATSTNGNYLIEEADDTDLKKAEAEYEHELDIIDRKETKMDNELAKLETERKAITTELDSLKTVKDDNIDRTFGIFG